MSAEAPALRLRPIELQIWLSPAFPVGSFAYSHGLEWAAATGRVSDRASAQAWLADLLACGAPRNDAILLASAWRLVASGRHDGLNDLNALALAMAGSRERYLETAQQGCAFLGVVCAAWSHERLVAIRKAMAGDVAYPVAVGCAAAAHDMELRAVLPGFLISIVQNLVSGLVRMSVIGQTDGQRIIAFLAPAIAEAAERTIAVGLDDLGAAAFVSDIATMAHETQETRLFRS